MAETKDANSCEDTWFVIIDYLITTTYYNRFLEAFVYDIGNYNFYIEYYYAINEYL